MKWHEAIVFEKYDDQYEAFRRYFESYTDWFSVRSNFARYIMKLGLYVFVYGGLLYFLNGGSIDAPFFKQTSPISLTIQSTLFIAPLFIIALALCTDKIVKNNVVMNRCFWSLY